MYYLLSSNSRPRRWIDDSPYIKGLDWWRGAVITVDVPNPLEFTLDPYEARSPAEDQ